MSRIPLYPLRFEPIYQYRLWGGRRLADLLAAPLPGDGPIGEAWLLSDRDDHASLVANGPLQGATIRQLLEQSPEPMLGRSAGRFHRFPLLLKFLDARDVLSVQVHPADGRTDLLPRGESGKTEAWVVLETSPKSRIYAGLQPGTTADVLRQALAKRTVADHLASFAPRPGDAVFIQAGTVHSLADVVVFEVQQNSDVTFRLYDWDRVDAKTGQPRALHIDQALACIDFSQGAIGPRAPVVESATPVLRERLFDCEHFRLWRLRGERPFTVGAAGAPRVLVCIDGAGQLEHGADMHAVRKGDVLLLPAVVGACVFQPRGRRELVRGRDAGATMKKLIVFDLDGTLAESKAALDDEMAQHLRDLLSILRVAVISGGNWPQFEAQLLANLPHDERLKSLSLLPTCGTKFFQYQGSWKEIYSEDFTDREKEKIISALKRALDLADFKPGHLWGKLIEDRGSQITFSALGQQAPIEEKKKWDPDFAKRTKIKTILDTLIPEFSVRMGGATSIDITKPGIDKAYGLRKLRDILGIEIKEMLFIGDALFPGGNDHPARETGVVCIQVRDPNETKRVIEAILACMNRAQPAPECLPAGAPADRPESTAKSLTSRLETREAT